MSFGCLLDFQMATIRGGSSLIDRNLNLHVVFHIFFATKTLGKIRVKTVSFTRVFVPLMVLEILKPTKSKTQVSMAHVPTTKSRTQHLNRKNSQVFGCLLDFQMATKCFETNCGQNRCIEISCFAIIQKNILANFPYN